MAGSMSYVIGVDVGGTNTDAVILTKSTVIAAAKRPTEDDKTSGIVNAIRAALDCLPAQQRTQVLANVARVSIGTTHFVNAVAERDRGRLARVAVIRLCGSASRALPPFVDFPDDLRSIICGGVHMVSGGLEYNGEPISDISENELRECVQEILKQDPPVRNVVIAGVFSPRDRPNEGQEVRAARIVQNECPEISCTLSHGLGLLGLIERENAAILNQSLRPLAKHTIAAFRQALDDLGLTCEFYLTQNDGTLISAEEALQYPVLTFSSGPTNSMRGAVFLSGLKNAIVVDIGGTTSDVGVLKNGFPREASTQLKVGGVRTNFCMPDVQTIALGGGSLVHWDATSGCVQVGPRSVANKLERDALCFGGQTCTTTDISIAAGVAPVTICRNEECQAVVRSQGAAMVYATMQEIRRKLENVIDSVKVEKDDVPVLLVGGGRILVDCSVPLRGASRIITPSSHGDVANAVGAALGTVGGTCEWLENLTEVKEELKKEGVEEGDELERRARVVVLQRGREHAKNEAIKKGAKPDSVYIHTEDVSDVAYVPGRVRVKVKAIGALSDAPRQQPPSIPVIPNPPQILPTAPLAQDNPHWPNCSAEDKERDEAAGLPPPTIQAGEWVLSSGDVECLALGAGILGCGGGGDPNMGRVMAQEQLKAGKEIRVVNPFRVDASQVGLVTCVAFMGAPAVLSEKLASGEETLLALRTMQRVLASGVYAQEGNEGKTGNDRVATSCQTLPTGSQVWIANPEDLAKIDYNDQDIPLSCRVTTLVCAEVGGLNSIEPLLVGARTGLPVIDADGMGRAFPELQMYLPFIYGCKPYPSCVADNKGEVICCTHVSNSRGLEDFFRVECVRMGMQAGVSIGIMTLQEVFDCCVLFSLSMAWQLGRAVQRARNMHTSVIDAIVEQQNGLLIIVGKVVSVTRVVEGGFVRVTAVVEGLDTFAGHHIKLIAQNEFYIAQYIESDGSKPADGPVLVCTPDLICVIDSDTGYPVTTEIIRYGMRVGVLALPANPRLKTPQALAVVGPSAFGFTDIPYAEPKSLQQIGKM